MSACTYVPEEMSTRYSELSTGCLEAAADRLEDKEAALAWTAAVAAVVAAVAAAAAVAMAVRCC